MKTITKYILAGLALGSVVSCKDRMIEFNSNPNTVAETKMEYLFTGAVGGFDYSRGVIIDKYSSAMQLMQYVSKYGDGNPYANPTLPESKSVSSYTYYYNQYFTNQGNKLQTILDQIALMSPEEQILHTDIKAIVKTVMAFQQWRILEHYGAIVFKDAYKAQTEHITRPAYDLGQDVYKDIDALFKEAITVLSAPAVPDVRQLGLQDYFYGYTNNALEGGGSAVIAISDYAAQRSNWMRFANVARLQMAWKLKKTDANFFETVKNEVLAVPSGLMASLDQGAFFNYPSTTDNNPDDVDVVSQQYAISNTLLSVLKATNDPRLQYLARPNGVSPVNSFNYRMMQTLFPDSLTKYGEILKEGNIFQGQVSNPRFQGFRPVETALIKPTNPNFVGVLSMTFNLKNTNYPNDLVYTDPTNNEDVIVCPGSDEKFSVGIQIASPAQGRYFVKSGGKGGKNGNLSLGESTNSLRFDGTGADWDLRLRRPLLTYPQQCFMLAHLGISTGGKSALDWYKEGVKYAMIELREDALRYKIQVAVETSYPRFPGYNAAGKFSYTDGDIDAYVAARIAAPGFNVAEDAINQAWIYFYQMPEEAYSWWKVSGFPKFLEHATPEQSAMVTNAYLEQPYKNSTELEPLAYPRRGVLPGRADTNGVNYEAIKDLLQVQPGFGDWSHTTGRIWWDAE